MIVSGHVVFDERGRLQAQGQPIFTTDAANVLVDVPTRDPGSVERSTSWTYDVLGRVVNVRTPSDVEDVGTNFVNIATTYGSTHPHAVSRMSEQWPAESSRYNRDFTYDGSGNQTKSVYRGSDTREITWNEDDQPITIAFNTQVRSKNLYDGEGQRAVSQHLVSALEETAYVSPDLTIRDGKYLTKHVYAGTTQLASKVDSAWLNYPPTLYFHTDQVNSTQYASMDDQTLIQHDEYFPSGELWRDETDSRYELARRHTFTGKELDIGTGLYYFGARYYDGHTSQWLSPDPILGRYLEGAINRGVYSPKNLGLYTFAWNNPTTCIDSNGLFVDEARQAVEVTTKVLAPGVPVALAEPTPAGEFILAGAFAVAVVGAFIYYEVSGSDSPKPSTPAPAPASGVTPSRASTASRCGSATPGTSRRSGRRRCQRAAEAASTRHDRAGSRSRQGWESWKGSAPTQCHGSETQEPGEGPFTRAPTRETLSVRGAPPTRFATKQRRVEQSAASSTPKRVSNMRALLRTGLSRIPAHRQPIVRPCNRY
jgi:RHS repeat-associated protein